MLDIKIKMTPAAEKYITSYFTEDELKKELADRDGDQLKLLREVINKFFRDLRRKRQDIELVVIDRDENGVEYYRMNSDITLK